VADVVYDNPVMTAISWEKRHIIASKISKQMQAKRKLWKAYYVGRKSLP